MTLMWLVVVLAIITFVVIIIIGHTNSFGFFYGLEDNYLVTASATVILDKLG